jgi:hypothetical protein
MKGSLFGMVLAGIAAVGAGALGAAGCSSSSSGGGGGSTPPGLYCATTSGGNTITCAGYTNLPAADQMDITTACTDAKGTIVSSCPSANEVGCCSVTIDGYTENICYYCGPASDYSASCPALGSGATWTAGSGGAATCGGETGDAGEPDSATGEDSGTPATDAATGG